MKSLHSETVISVTSPEPLAKSVKRLETLCAGEIEEGARPRFLCRLVRWLLCCEVLGKRFKSSAANAFPSSRDAKASKIAKSFIAHV